MKDIGVIVSQIKIQNPWLGPAGQSALGYIIIAALAVVILPLNLQRSTLPRHHLRVTSSPPQQVIDDLKVDLSPEFVSLSTIDPLTLGGGQAIPGQAIHFTGASFIPFDHIYVELSLPGDLTVSSIATSVQVDANGNIDGDIQIPATAKGGRWLVKAIDIDDMYNQLQTFGNTGSADFNFYLQAANVTIPSNVMIPLVKK